MATKCSRLVCAVHREQKLILACIGWSAGIQPDSTLVGSLPVCDLARMPQCVTPLAIVHDRPAATPESAAFVDKTVDRMMRGASYDTTAVRAVLNTNAGLPGIRAQPLLQVEYFTSLDDFNRHIYDKPLSVLIAVHFSTSFESASLSQAEIPYGSNPCLPDAH